VTLTLKDIDGASASFSRAVTLSAPPNASFTYVCNVLSCNFNASGSTDAGSIVSYRWDFGDATTGSGLITAHVFASPGIYAVTLLVTDNNNGTSTRTQSIPVYLPLHIGDLDVATSSQANQWSATATITIHDHNHLPVANVVVTGSWNDGLQSCITNTAGRCSLSRQEIPKKTTSVTFLVLDATLAMCTYTSSSNHDPDGDSNGTTVTAKR
jgi:PKD repeat protein